MRTPQDIINRKEANQRYYKLEENKQQKIKDASNDDLHAINSERFINEAQR